MGAAAKPDGHGGAGLEAGSWAAATASGVAASAGGCGDGSGRMGVLLGGGGKTPRTGSKRHGGGKRRLSQGGHDGGQHGSDRARGRTLALHHLTAQCGRAVWGRVSEVHENGGRLLSAHPIPTDVSVGVLAWCECVCTVQHCLSPVRLL